MNRPYTAQSPYSLTPTERIRSPRGGGRRSGRYGGYGTDTDDPGRYDDLDTDALPPYHGSDYDAEDDYDAENYDEYLDEARLDRRWMWIAGVAGAILFVAVITASMILGGGDSGSVSATVASPLPTSSAPEPSAAPTPRVAVPAAPSLPAETVTTVSPTAETPVPEPTTPAPLLPAPQAAPPPAAAAPGTVTYRITGNRALLDLVTVIYTDAQGALQTDVNAALPWSKTIVLNPGVTLSSVTATSVSGQLNCAILDANGSPIAVQNNNSIITNCTR
ncbi:MmpS family transport accessory protein [Mycolicibacterium sp. BiH015]|uniref:MmpS family transport accessory protein n=1 Tax=Mycolicibacterium sp. BiH015 TaxID=3018808 RepID=UPI0022E36264|nr:MmpS family transport accessory protein [Mycolicibacterium sp. BiH015]MDA2894386.1 MmpS family transport accessory protein [Mycolicibacterium sp. BiH015]